MSTDSETKPKLPPGAPSLAEILISSDAMPWREKSLKGLSEKMLWRDDATGASMTEIARDAIEEAFESMPKARRRDPDAVAEAVRRAVRGAIAERWRKKPICHVHVLVV